MNAHLLSDSLLPSHLRFGPCDDHHANGPLSREQILALEDERRRVEQKDSCSMGFSILPKRAEE
jgi:hypothetical protein